MTYFLAAVARSFIIFVLVGSFKFVLLGSFNFVLLGSYTCKYKYNNNRRCLQLPAVRRYCLTRPGASPEGGLGVSWQLARSKVVFFFWLYVHGTDITLPPGEVFTRDWDGSLDSGEAATERSSMSTAETELVFW